MLIRQLDNSSDKLTCLPFHGSQLRCVAGQGFATQLHTDYGCPSSAWLRLSFAARSVNLTLELYNKTATRLGEAAWLTFAPNASSYQVDKLGSWTDPLDVVDGGAKSLHGLTDGVRATIGK